MENKRFQGKLERLRSPERVQMLEVEKVVESSLKRAEISTVLDIGAGTGIFSEAFARKNKIVTATDVNEEMLLFMKKLPFSFKLIKADMDHLPFFNRTFDLIFMSHVLHETNSPLRALAEAQRVAKKLVTILEPPYRDESYGPPLHHRLKAEEVIHWANQLSFSKVEKIDLKFMVLFHFSI